MNDIYAAPTADLESDNPSQRLGGNIEDAVDGNIRISVGEILGQAWRSVKGFKLVCHIALTIYVVVAILAGIVSIPVVIMLTATGADQSVTGVVASVIQTLASIATIPMFFGIHIMGIRHLAGKPVSVGSVFQFFYKIPRLFLCYLLVSFMIFIGFLLLILPGIYLSVAYMYALPLVVEKDLPAWQAMEISRKAIGKNWFSMFGLLLIIMLMNMLGLLTLGIAWIWIVPWSILAMSLVHLRLFGAEAHTLAA
jgi:hypothetical protein